MHKEYKEKYINDALFFILQAVLMFMLNTVLWRKYAHTLGYTLFIPYPLRSKDTTFLAFYVMLNFSTQTWPVVHRIKIFQLLHSYKHLRSNMQSKVGLDMKNSHLHFMWDLLILES
jgi:hypothetical protein